MSEDELRHSLGLAGYTTGKGKPALADNIRAIEVYMCSVVRTVTRGGWDAAACQVVRGMARACAGGSHSGNRGLHVQRGAFGVRVRSAC